MKTKTKSEIEKELVKSRQRITELEASDSGRTSDRPGPKDRKVMQELRETRDYLENLINYANAPIIVWDPTFRITRFNHAFEGLTGYKTDDVVGKELSILFPDASRAESMDRIKATSGGEYWESVEIPILCKSGDIRLALWNSANIYAEDGKTLVSTIAQGTDITELKQKEKQINKTKVELENILNTVPIHIASIDINGKYNSWNRASEDMFGFKAEELIGKLTPRRFHRNDEEARAVIDTADRNGMFDGEVILCRKDGSEFPAHLLVTKNVDSKGNQIGYTGVAVDITERKLAEAQKTAVIELLRESEEQYRGIFESAGDTFLIVNPDGEIVEANPAACKMYGYTHDELIGLSGKDIVHPDYYYLFEDFKKKVKSGGLFYAESVDVRKDRSTFNMEVHGAPYKYRRKPHLLAVVRDITERKRAEEELIRLSNAVKMSTDSIVISDLEGKIIDVNEATLEMYGTDDNRDLVGKSSFDIIVPEDREKAFAGMKEVMEKGYIKDREYHIVIKDGSKIPVEMSTSIMKGSDSAPIGFIGVTRDITERKKSEQALRESEEKYRTLVDSAPILISVHQNGKWVMVSKTTMELLGYKKEDELLGKPALEILHPDFREFAAKRIQKMAKTGKPAPLAEEQLLKQDGGVMNVLVSSTPIFYKGEPAFQVTAVDITERKRTEEELQESEERYKDLWENAPVAYHTLDTKGIITRVNQTEAKMLGCIPEEMVGKSIFEFILPEQQAEAKKRFRRKLSGEHISKAEDRIYVKKDGTKVYVAIDDVLGRDSDGKVLSVRSTMINITERKQAEKELENLYTESQEARKSLLSILADVTEKEQSLRESEEKYRAIFDNISEGIYRTTPDGKIIFANPALIKMLGYDSAEELLKVNVRDGYKSPGDSQKFVELIDRNGRVYGFESIWKKKDGTALFIRENASIVRDENGEILYYDGTVEDITDRVRREEEHKRLEKQLHQSQKMESVGQLAGGIAHDFNNILTIISGYSQLLLERLDKNTPLRKNVEKIMKAGEQAASLTRQLLAFSRKQALAPKVLDLNAMLADLKKMLGRLIGEDIKMDTVLEPDLMHVKVDPGQIEQVIMNLVVNARDAMPDGGKITVRTENVDIDKELSKVIPEALPGRFVRFSVEDAGVGIDKAIIDQIFEPFFTTKDVGVGTGLGLSVVYGIIKQHDGWINVYSEPGQGTIFKVYLPAVSAEIDDITKDTISLKELKGSGERILLVEDEEGIRGFAAEALRESGYIIFEAANAKEAHDLFINENGNFDLVFSDVVMPGKSGLELVDELISGKPDLQVLLCSGYSDKKSQWHEIKKRGFRFLQKPYAVSDLLKIIREIISPE